MRHFGLLVLWVVVFVGACRPYALVGEPCLDAPCSSGLQCVEGTCVAPDEAEAQSSTCVADAECQVQGNADGRRCVDGACAWESCLVDGQCGTRICDLGVCAVRRACADDDDCEGGALCVDNACRAPCAGDDTCAGLFQQCGPDGRCRQRCLGDALCFGDICEEGVCVAPQCNDDEGCAAEPNRFCDAGRCATFVPCALDDDCFDPNYFCNELLRCEERETCASDSACGVDTLCLDEHCRPNPTCGADSSSCEAGKECVAGRCVTAPGCRFDGDCGPEEACVRAQCRPRIGVAVDELLVMSGLGTCSAAGDGACALSMFVGEQATLSLLAVSGDEVVVPSSPSVTTEQEGLLQVERVSALAYTVTPTAVGNTTLLFAAGGKEHRRLNVTVLAAAPPEELAVLVVDRVTGAPAEAVAVSVTGSDVEVAASTDGHGVVRLALPVGVSAGRITALRDGQGVVLFDADFGGAYRLLWPPAPTAPSRDAGFFARVSSTGDETGAVGVGLALPSVPRLADLRLPSLFGEAAVGALDVPVLGAVALELPAVMTLEASLPLSDGVTEVRPAATVLTNAGLTSVTAFEGRYDLQLLFALVGSQDVVELALDRVAGAEAMDVAWSTVGDLPSVPWVEDVNDLDGDGDTSELVVDVSTSPTIDIAPTTKPSERVGVSLGPVPAGARERVFLAAGLSLPGYRVVPTGIGAFVPTDSAPRQLMNMAAPTEALAAGARVLSAEALFENGEVSVLWWRGSAFAPVVDLGAFLTPPRGALVFEGLGPSGERVLVLPSTTGATAYRARLEGNGVTWQVYGDLSATGGRTMPLSGPLADVSDVLALEVFRFDDAAASSARRLFGATRGPLAEPLDEVRAYAAVRNGDEAVP